MILFIINLIKGKEVIITFNYDNVKQIDYLLKDQIITNKKYDNDISYTLHISNNENIKEILDKYINNYEDIKDIYIEKK